LLEVWNTEIVPTARKRGAQVAPHERLQPSSGLGKLVRQRLDQHGLDRCLSVVRWFGSADHPRAQFLRDGGHELSTLMRPQKFDEYAAFAEAPVALVGRHKHDPAPARAPPPVMSREEYERELALQAEIDRKREAERRPLWTK
jgi:hypothetical protein